MSPIRILLVEDFIPYRNLIVKLLSKNPDLCVISEIDDGIEAVEQAQRLRPDLILMDIGLPRLNGLAAARQIFGLVPTAKIVYLTQMTDVDVVEEALSAGAAGYVLEREAKHVLLPPLATILKGNRFVSDGLSRNGSAEA